LRRFFEKWARLPEDGRLYASSGPKWGGWRNRFRVEVRMRLRLPSARSRKSDPLPV
jgi:hypothetical protein